MAKVRSLEELNDKLTADLARRKKEITYLKTAISKSSGSSQASFMRAGVTILYAHWEGFIKASANFYLFYVINKMSDKRLKIHSTFQISALWNTFRKNENNIKNPILFTEKVAPIVLEGCKPENFGSVFDFTSNVNSEEVEKIMVLLGLDHTTLLDTEDTSLPPPKNVIDVKLVDTRNAIAHGEHRELALDDYELVEKLTLGLMDSFSNIILNAASTQSYLSDS